MPQITYLKPNNPYKTVLAKTWKAEPDGTIKLVSGYNAGERFDVEVDEVKTIEDVYTSLSARSKGHIRIAGHPAPTTSYTLTPRNGQCFPCGESTLIALDLDKWPASDEPWDYRDPASVHATVRRLLTAYGYEEIAKTDMVVLTTSSQWDNDTLSCHLYLLISDPIHLNSLHEWCTAVKSLRPTHQLDPALQRPVQPDYIAPRTCTNFKDPRPEKARLFIAYGEQRILPTPALVAIMQRDMAASGWVEGLSAVRTPLGPNWLATLTRCGMDGEGIHDLSRGAAAQLLHEVGRDAVVANADQYAKQMHAALWDALNKNDPWKDGARDRQKDIDTYTVKQLRADLLSACKKGWEDQVTILSKIVEDAIDEASLGEVAQLHERTVVDAWHQLAGKHPGKMAEIRQKFKSRLKGVITLGEYEKTARKTALTKPDQPTGMVPDGGDNAAIQAVLARFDWLEDEFGQLFAGWSTIDGGEYRVAAVDSPLSTVLYATGMEVTGANVSARFGHTALQLVLGQAAQGVSSRFKRTPIGVRVYPVGGPYSPQTGTWIHLGEQPAGPPLCAFVDAKEVQIVSEKDCPVRWRLHPEQAGIPVATMGEIEARYGTIDDLKRWTMHRLPEFLNLQLDSDHVPAMLGAVFALMSGRGASPIIEFVGAAGSGKSTAADLIQSLCDPVKGAVGSGAGRADLKTVREPDLVDVVSRRYLTIFDNVSKLRPQQQDTFCTLSTGTSIDKRIMYVGNFVKIHAKRPILLTCISSTINRPDLESRTTRLTFQSWGSFRVSPTDLATLWDEERPYLYVGMLHLLQDALSRTNGVTSSDGVETRRQWFSLADQLYYTDEERLYAQAERRLERDRRLAEQDEVALALVTYLTELETEQYVRGIDKRLHEIQQDYLEWLTAKLGTTFNTVTSAGTIRWKLRSINDQVYPRTIQGFGWSVMKHANTIRSLTGWVVGAEKIVANKKVRQLWYKPEDEFDSL